jgi:hypothetical protein
MIATLFNVLRNTFCKFNCKQCKFKSMFSLAMVYHLYKKHHIRPTRKDFKFLIMHSLLARLIKSAIILPLFVVLVVLKVVLFPLYCLYEIL